MPRNENLTSCGSTAPPRVALPLNQLRAALAAVSAVTGPAFRLPQTYIAAMNVKSSLFI